LEGFRPVKRMDAMKYGSQHVESRIGIGMNLDSRDKTFRVASIHSSHARKYSRDTHTGIIGAEKQIELKEKMRIADKAVGDLRVAKIGNCGRVCIGQILAGLFALVITGLVTCSAHAAQVQNRVTAPIRSAQMQSIHGTVHPKVAISEDLGPLNASTPIEGMSLVFGRSATQESDLKRLLQQLETPGSPIYHQWLQPAQFAARYGMSASDLAKAVAWLQSQGFKVDFIPPSNDQIYFSGTVAQVNAAFKTQMHQYSLRGRMHWANATEISLPQALAGVAIGVGHLNTFRPRPHLIQRQVSATRRSAGVTPQYTVQLQGGADANFTAPADIATIYDLTGIYNGGFTGTGQTIAIVGQTDITKYESDIANFRSLSGLNASNLPTQVLIQTPKGPDTGPATVSVGDLAEADIDTEWSGAVAKDAKIVYVTVGSNLNYNVFDSLTYAIKNLVASVISVSYGGCEQEIGGSSVVQQFENVLEQANAQGQTVVVSSGDDGSATCDDGDSPASAAQYGLAVSYPASSQFVTAVGGTSFAADISDQAKYWSTSNNGQNGSALSYIPETTWNNTPTLADFSNQGALSASGGGASQLFSKPSWQVGRSIADGQRDLPDVSLAADPNHDGYVLCTEETNGSGANETLSGTPSCAYPVGAHEVAYFDQNLSGNIFGGTSIAAPQLAAMITLWNQETGNTAGVGNANPIFYLLAQNTPGAFHDVTTGSNAVVCKQGSPNCVSGANGYIMSCCNAGPGYDLATGLGSIDATAMGAAWPKLAAVNAGFSILLNPSAISVTPGGSVTTSIVLNASGVGADSAAGFSGAVSLACTNLPAGVSCSFNPGSSVNLSPGSPQTVTLSISATTAAAATSVARLSPANPLQRGWPIQTALAGMLGIAMLGFGRKRRFFPSRWMVLLLLAAGLVAASALTACGSSSPAGGGSINPGGGGSTPATQTVTVTGTSGTTTASTQIQLTVL
jgi:subtilase family serine protease